MPSRMIRTHGGAKVLLDTLASLLMLEALKPSKEIYIISPWVSNSTIALNDNNKYTDLFPFVESKSIYLADILSACALKGSEVRIICNPQDQWTKEFLNIVRGKVECRKLKDNHEKGMVTQNYYLHGSMNFTYSGIYINGESVRITTETSEVSHALISARARWEESEKI